MEESIEEEEEYKSKLQEGYQLAGNEQSASPLHKGLKKSNSEGPITLRSLTPGVCWLICSRDLLGMHSRGELMPESG